MRLSTGQKFSTATGERLKWMLDSKHYDIVPDVSRSLNARGNSRGGCMVVMGEAADDASAAAEARMSPLWNWLSTNNANVSAIKTVWGGKGHGLVLSRAVVKGEVVAVLPRALMLQYKPSEMQDLVNSIPSNSWPPSPNFKSSLLLALQVLREMSLGSASNFASYLGSVPPRIEGLPQFYTSGAAFDELQGPLTSIAKSRCSALYKLATGPLAGPKDAFNGCSIDLGALGYALAIVSSRAFKWDGPDSPPTLLPMVDIANHALEPNIKVQRAVKDGSAKMVALKDMQEGEELSISYGELENDFLVLDYGFAIPDNPIDRVALRLDWDFVLKAAAREGLSLGMYGGVPEAWQEEEIAELAASNTELLLGGPKYANGNLVKTVRTLCAHSQEEASLVAKLDTLDDVDASDMDTLKLLMGLCAETLSRYPTTLEQDDALLASDTCQGDLRMAVVYRATKKRVLQECEKWFRMMFANAEASFAFELSNYDQSK